MASAIKTLYTTLKTQIETEVTAIKTVKLFNSQFDNDDKEEAFAYPAVMIEFQDINWDNNLGGLNLAEFTLTFHIAQESYTKEDDVDYLDLVNDVYVALQLFDAADFTPLARIADRQDTNHDMCIVWQMDFRTKLTDCSADPRLKQVESAGPHALTINADLDIDNDTIRTGDGTV
ncbi:MAG: hypothetical protein ACQ9ET_00190 [Nitrosomonadaceae bacterium]